MSAVGTVAETPARLTRRANITRNLLVSRTTSMPHRPSSNDGQSSVFVSSNPIGRRQRLPKIARRCARLSLAIGGFGSAAVPTVSHRRRTVRHGFYRIPERADSPLSRVRRRSPPERRRGSEAHHRSKSNATAERVNTHPTQQHPDASFSIAARPQSCLAITGPFRQAEIEDFRPNLRYKGLWCNVAAGYARLREPLRSRLRCPPRFLVGGPVFPSAQCSGKSCPSLSARSCGNRTSFGSLRSMIRTLLDK
jgi:hypothetical protein